jgi:hypothetical protein
VDGRLLPQLANKTHRFLAVARSTLVRIDDDPSWDAELKQFQFWTAQSPESRQRDGRKTLAPGDGHASGDVRAPGAKFDWSIEEDEDDDEAFERHSRSLNDDFFDARYFSDRVYWPAINVLLLSNEKDGVVERLGVGKIHVDAFEPIASLEKICLG